jgi:hypothetical protein
MRVLRVQPRLLTRPGGLARLVEALLGSVAAVGMEGGRPAQRVFQAFTRRRRQPNPLLAVHAIVAHQRIGVDTPALRVESVSFRFRQGAGELEGAQHWATLLSFLMHLTVHFHLTVRFPTSGNGKGPRRPRRSPPNCRR